MLQFVNPIVAGAGILVRPAIQSPNFVTGLSGWFVGQDGSSEFNNMVVRGTFVGTDYVINSAGEFFYNGTPAANNLIFSVTNAAGIDDKGNAYFAGTTTYKFDTLNGNRYIAVNQNGTVNDGNVIEFWFAASQAGPWTRTAAVNYGVPLGGTTPVLGISTDSPQSLGTLPGYTVTEGLFELLPFNRVELRINVTGGGANAATATWSVTLPPIYRPQASKTLALTSNQASPTALPRVGITPAGVVTLSFMANIASAVTGVVSYPLD